jgi:hypothetical protein
MEWGLVKKRVLEAVRHFAEGDAQKGEWADAIEECLTLAEEVHRTRQVHADLRGRLDKMEQDAVAMRQALQNIEAGYCRCDVKAGCVCGIHAIVQRALDGESDGPP